jgi:methylisocitrate lyase
MSALSTGQLLRDAIRQRCIQVPGAPNALAGRLIEQMGFDAVYLSGAALSAGVLGVPDVGLFTLTELAQQTAYLARSVALPVIVDADTGFGDAINVERTVEELERAGAAAIQLEDQQLPKRCGHLSGKTLVTTESMCAKLRAAAEAKLDQDLVIIARTDARDVEGFDAAVNRAQAYLDAGADWIFPEALADVGEFERFSKAIQAPLVANMTEFGKSPLLTHAQLAKIGYSAVLYPVTLLRIFLRAAEAALAVLADDGTQKELLDLMQTREELYELLGYRDFEERDRQYFGTQKTP